MYCFVFSCGAKLLHFHDSYKKALWGGIVTARLLLACLLLFVLLRINLL